MRNEHVRTAIEADLAQLETQRRKLTEGIDARIESLRQSLKLLDSGGFFQPFLPLMESDAEPKAAKLTLVQPGGNTVAALGLRGAIKVLLAEYPPGLRGAEITEKLVARGYDPKGSMSASALVFSELSRLKKMRILSKVGRGKYRLATVGSATA